MKAKELKLGDWVSYKGTSQVKVVELKEGDCRFLHVAEDYTFIGGVCHAEPIRLTEDILELNGWLPASEISGYYMPYNNIYIYFYNRQKFAGVLIKDNFVCMCRINYVHELQHILWALGLDDALKLPSH